MSSLSSIPLLMNPIRHVVTFLLLGLLVNWDGVRPATAQIIPDSPAPAAPRYGEPQMRRYRVGAPRPSLAPAPAAQDA